MLNLSARQLVLDSYDIPKAFYGELGAASRRLRSLGMLVYYADLQPHTGRRRRIPVDIPAMVEKWKRVVVGLVTAHDKDEADRYEAGVDECLVPILTAPIKQVREFAGALLEALKSDPSVPFLVWRAYEVWVQEINASPDGEMIELKTVIAREIAQMVESDVKAQLGDALVRALEWRSAEKLAEVKQVVADEKAAGRPVRLRGRESCLFLEAGGSESKPTVCVQI